MELKVLANFLGWAADGDHVTITVRKDALQRALEMADGGPEIMSTVQAAQRYGWTPKRWREWAHTGRVVGAWRDEQNTWRLPKASCVRLITELQERSAHPPRVVDNADHEAVLRPPMHRPIESRSQTRSIRRGPRKPKSLHPQ